MKPFCLGNRLFFFVFKELYWMKRSLLLVFLLSSFFLAACGGSAASTGQSNADPTNSASSSSSSGNDTSASANSPTVLIVTRTDPSSTNNLGPLNKTVSNTSTVQNLYSMAKVLPAYATQESISQSCLNDLGVIYHLDFRQGSAEVQRMNLDPGACKILYLSRTDLRQVNEAFLDLLKQAIQVTSLTSD
jgi:hypothetical protein